MIRILQENDVSNKPACSLIVTDEYDDEIQADILLGDTVVGSVSIITDYSEADGYCYVERIDILPEYRGRGIGTEVLTHTIYDNFGWKCRTVIVAPDNLDARRLYARLGEETTGDINRIFGDYDQGFGVYAI